MEQKRYTEDEAREMLKIAESLAEDHIRFYRNLLGNFSFESELAVKILRRIKTYRETIPERLRPKTEKQLSDLEKECSYAIGNAHGYTQEVIDIDSRLIDDLIEEFYTNPNI